MHRPFNPTHRSRLDTEERRRQLPPEETLKALGLTPEDSMADIGCGIGYFTLAAARMLRLDAPLYALDISDTMLEALEERRRRLGVRDIQGMRTDGRTLPLEEEAVTFALMVNVLHEVEDPIGFLREVERILKPGGKLALVEWRKAPMEEGPPLAHRVGEEEIAAWMRGRRFLLRHRTSFSQRYDAWVYEKMRRNRDEER